MSDMEDDTREGYAPQAHKYVLSGKIMLFAIVVLFTVVVLIICLHVYSRWFLARARRRQQALARSRRRRAAQIIFISELPSTTTISKGLDASLLKSLPTFIYTSNTHDAMECAVCLSEFEENEKCRLLPKCSHMFHTACIDMWFCSHDTCPLCRAPVEAPVEIVVEVPSCEHEVGSSSSNLSVGDRRKWFENVGVTIQVPRRNESFKSMEEQSVTQASPGGRILSFKRLLSRDRRPSAPSTPSTPIPISSCNSTTFETDLESGEIVEQLQQTPTSTSHQRMGTTSE